MATPKGRTIRKDEPEQQRPFAAQPGGQPASPAGTPFGGFGPDAKSMYASAEENREKSVSVLVIVGGVIFAIVSALIIALAMLLLLLVYRQTQQGGEVATADDPQHVRDTAVADPLQQPPDRPGPRPGPGGVDGGEKSVRDPAMGPPPGSVTVIVPTEMLFQSIEVSCPSGFRDRGTLRKESKTTERGIVYNVPGGERCTITFQGSEPAKSWASAGDSLSCTFNPVVCRKL